VRLWTLHPRYLDSAGLVALWRETLLARAVLAGNTKGYRHHPQLTRFRAQPDPVGCVNRYLSVVYEEASRRGYRFDERKLTPAIAGELIVETRGQIEVEWLHLLEKLRRRSPERYRALSDLRRPRPHPLFRIVPGAAREWERGVARGPRTS
jgi:hypothetical protein